MGGSNSKSDDDKARLKASDAENTRLRAENKQLKLKFESLQQQAGAQAAPSPQKLQSVTVGLVVNDTDRSMSDKVCPQLNAALMKRHSISATFVPVKAGDAAKAVVLMPAVVGTPRILHEISSSTYKIAAEAGNTVVLLCVQWAAVTQPVILEDGGEGNFLRAGTKVLQINHPRSDCVVDFDSERNRAALNELAALLLAQSHTPSSGVVAPQGQGAGAGLG